MTSARNPAADCRGARGRVLVLTSTFPRWAGDTTPGFVHELCRRLVDRGFRVDVLAPRAPLAAGRERLDGMEVHRYPYFFRRYERLAYDGGILPNMRSNPLLVLLLPFFVAGLCRAIRKRLRRQSYDVVHAHWLIPQGVCAALIAPPVPLIITTHGSDVLSMKNKLVDGIRGWALERASAVTVVSESLQDEISARFPAVRTSILPMGADLEHRFSPAANVQRDEASVVCIGRLNTTKGVQHLLHAIANLVEEQPMIRLDIVGDGPARAMLEQLSASLGINDRTTFHGALPQHEAATFLRRAAVAAFPSLQEGLGLVVVEAMGTGCPVVASDLPAMRGLVTNEESGLLVEPGNAAAMAAGISRLLGERDLREKLAVAGRAAVRSRFDWQYVADRYAEFVDAVLESGPNAGETRSGD